jgi:hypothetical protein
MNDFEDIGSEAQLEDLISTCTADRNPQTQSCGATRTVIAINTTFQLIMFQWE